MSRKSVIGCCLLLGLIVGCKSRPGIELPKELNDAREVKALDRGHLLVRTGNGILYSFDLNVRKAQQLVTGDYFVLSPLGNSGRVFVSYVSDAKRELAIVDSAGLHPLVIDAKLPLDSYAICGADEQIVICGSDAGVAEDAPGYNPFGINAITVIDLEKGTSRWFKVPTLASYFYFDVKAKQVWLNPNLNENSEKGEATIIDLDGRPLRKKRVHASIVSPTGSFAVPQLHEGGLPWEIYDTLTWKPVLKLNQKTELEEDNFADWNPVRDLLPITRCKDLSSGGSSCWIEIYDPGRRQIIKSLQGSDQFLCWSLDGKELFTFDRGKLIRTPIP